MRERVGAASLLACPLVLTVFLAIRYGVSPWACLRVMFGLYALFLVPGYLIQRFVFAWRGATTFETAVASLLLGTLVSPALWYACCIAGVSRVFVFVIVVLAVATPLGLGWHRDLARRVRVFVSREEAPIVLGVTLLAVLWSLRLDLVSVRGDGVVVLPHNDHRINVAMVAEYARKTPPEVLPFLSPARKWAYHNMPHVWSDMLRRVSGLDARDAYFHFALPLRYVLLPLACYLALVRRFGRSAATIGAMGLLAFVGYPLSEYVLTNWLLTYLYWNVPACFGLIVIFLILCYASRVGERYRATLLLISLLSVGLLWYKANFALVVAPAVAVWTLWVLWQRGDMKWAFACLGAQALLLAVRVVDMCTADFRASLAFEPFRFISYLWWQGTLWLTEVSKTSVQGWPVSLLLSIRRNVDALPEALRIPMVFALCMAFLFHVGLLIAAYARLRMDVGRLRSRANPTDVLAILILLSCALGFVFLPVHETLVWNVSKHNFAVVHALLLALMGPVLWDIVRRIRRSRRSVTVLGTGLLIVAMAGNAWALHAKITGPVSDVQDVISPGRYACFRYIERSAPQDAVVLQPEFETGLLTGALLTQRRVAVEWAHVWQACWDTSEIVAGLRAFYAGTDAKHARETLAQYHVTHIVADAHFAERNEYEAFLKEGFRCSDDAVFAVESKGPVVTAD